MNRLVAVACAAALLSAQDLRILGRSAPEFHNPDRMLRAWLTRIALEQLAARKREIARIGTPEEFERRRREFRRKLLEMIGGLPSERPPLNLRRTGRLDRGDYRVEKIVFESQPNFYVTANLYIPQTGGPRYPAVLHSTGHSVNAKSRPFYQTLSIGLVKHGFVVLTFDPLGQGERRIFFDPDLQDSKVGGPTAEHEMVGTQALLGGESIARHMIWDGMRAIDVLASLPEVDPKRIGITGCSGGGTLTTYLAALDERVAAAAPACYITSWEDQLQADTGPQDAEQQFPDLLANGYDHADYVTAFAPRPYLICSTDQDFFPIDGARKTFEEARRIWSLLGAKDRVDWFHEPGGHGMPQATREAIYGWMRRWLQNGPRGPAAEPKIQVEQEQDLYATPTGQLATSLGGETVSTLNRRRFARLKPAVPAPAKLAEEVMRATRIRQPGGPARLESTGVVRRDAYQLERLVYHHADGRYVPALLATPVAGARGRTVLHTAETGAAQAFAPGGDLDRLAALGYSVLAIDVGGRGETASQWRSYSLPWFGRLEKEAWLALMIGRTLVGLHAEDITLALEVLARKNLVPAAGVAGFGKGTGAVEMLHAAVLDARITTLLLEEMPLSYAAIARAPIHRQMFELVVPGVLHRYGLPDLAAALPPRRVSIVNPRSAVRTPVPLGDAREEYRRTADAYRAAGVPENFRIGLRGETDAVLDAFPELR